MYRSPTQLVMEEKDLITGKRSRTFTFLHSLLCGEVKYIAVFYYFVSGSCFMNCYPVTTADYHTGRVIKELTGDAEISRSDTDIDTRLVDWI